MMPHSPLRPLVARLHRDRGGYIMLIALLMMAILAVIGATTLQVAGIDQRIAIQNRKHMMTVNTAHAGTEHARYQLMHTDPPNEGLDTAGDTYGDFVTALTGETNFDGLAYTHNLGVYWVTATYHRCGNPPPGYSTELGNSKFRADYWEMEATARIQSSATSAATATMNETQSKSSALVRKVKFGSCKIR
jgi:type II secretory pathway pseudopilin PulG